ncbi:hypothetical protein E4T42_00706 [Aureobasidium subglaciale]|nr:hypothetical protein E4T42_00706 [Aureobasidium subglaciale]
MPTTNTTKRVSWAYPLIKSTPLATQQTPEQGGQNSTLAGKYSARSSRVNSPTAADSLREILLGKSMSPSPSSLASHMEIPNVSNDPSINSFAQQEQDANDTQEQARTEQSHRENQEHDNDTHRRHDREQEILSRDAFYSDPSQYNCWSAYCKFTETLASCDTAPSSDYFFSTSDVLVSLFIHCDLTQYGTKKMLAEDLLLQLIDHFPLCTQFRFAVFLPREQVEQQASIPKALKYLFGTFDALSCFDVSLDGAITDMETKFVALHWFHTRRLRHDTVQIHKDSLQKGTLTPRVEADDLNNEPMMADRLLPQPPQPKTTQPIDIKFPKQKHVSDAWIRPAKNQAVWA